MPWNRGDLTTKDIDIVSSIGQSQIFVRTPGVKVLKRFGQNLDQRSFAPRCYQRKTANISVFSLLEKNVSLIPE